MKQQIYSVSSELKQRIKLYHALCGIDGKEALDSVDELKYLCEPHPSFLDFITRTENENSETPK